MRLQKEEQERLLASIAALKAELMVCGKLPLKPISVLSSTLGYQPQQGQRELDRRCSHGKTAKNEGGKWSGQEYMEDEQGT